MKIERFIMTDALGSIRTPNSEIRNQMELGFDGKKLGAKGSRSERRITRGAWWFAHMRQMVDRAMDWPPGGDPRPEQIWLPGANRQVRVS